MMRKVKWLVIFCSFCLWILVVSTATAAQKPTFKQLSSRNVALKMYGYAFTSGVNEQGQLTTCNGVETAQVQWWGSGFIVKEDGTIVTNYHVAGKSLEGDAMFEDGSTYRITQIKVYDPIHDLAILKIVAHKKFSTVTLGNSDTVRPMDKILAVGNPMGQGINVTEGQISQLVRDDNNNIIMFRHTAPITGGNSGGALYKGSEVIGVNESVLIGSVGSQSGFAQAVPINFVKPLLGKEYNQNLALRDIFSPTAQTLKQKAKQVTATNGTVPAATAQDKPGIVTVPFDIYPLEDILFVVQAEQGKNLNVLVAGADRRLLGCDNGNGTNTDALIISAQYAQQVGINVVNLGTTPVNFGLTVYSIVW